MMQNMLKHSEASGCLQEIIFFFYINMLFIKMNCENK